MKHQTIPVTNKVKARKMLESYVVVTRVITPKKGKGSYNRNLFKKNID